MSVNGIFPTETSINLHIVACIISRLDNGRARQKLLLNTRLFLLDNIIG